jgi:hypothetical protein
MRVSKALSLRPVDHGLVALSPYEPDPEVDASFERQKTNLVVDAVIERILDHVRRANARMEQKHLLHPRDR